MHRQSGTASTATGRGARRGASLALDPAALAAADLATAALVVAEMQEGNELTIRAERAGHEDRPHRRRRI
jgi:hypothetical protein